MSAKYKRNRLLLAISFILVSAFCMGIAKADIDCDCKGNCWVIKKPLVIKAEAL